MPSNRRIDGLSDVLSSYLNQGGGSIGKLSSSHILTQQYLDIIYRYNGFGKRIIDLVANEMTRQWVTIAGDSENLVVARMEEIEAKDKMNKMLKWSRLYGGSIGIIGVSDGLELQEPVNEKRIQSVDFIHVFDRHQVTWTNQYLYQDPQNPKYGLPEYYSVTPYHGGANFLVHETRVMRIDGEELPERLKYTNQNWGDSVLQSIYVQLTGLSDIYTSTNSIIKDFVQTILSVENLSEIIGTVEGDSYLKERMEILNYSRNVANIMLLDSKESYEKKASSTSGLDALIDKFGLVLSAVTGIPYTFLFGQAPSGLQATGQADIRMFYDMIKSEQEDKLQPALEKLTRYIMLSSEGGFNRKQPDNWKVVFNPLWQLSEQEEAIYRKTVAETDAIYISMGVLDAAEVAVSRFGGNTFSNETEIDLEGREFKSVPEEEITEYAQEVQRAKNTRAQEAEALNKLDALNEEEYQRKILQDVINGIVE